MASGQFAENWHANCMKDGGEIITRRNGGIEMIAREFLSEFQKTRDAFNWKYVEKNRIRGFLKSGDLGEAFDPITATLFVTEKTGGKGSNPGEVLGLSPTDIEAINDAANDVIWKSVDDQLALDGYAAWFRDEIALVVGLELDKVPQSAPDQGQIATLVSVESVFDSEPQPQHV